MRIQEVEPLTGITARDSKPGAMRLPLQRDGGAEPGAEQSGP